MDEYDEPIKYWPQDFICDCDNPHCVDGLCNSLNWPDDEVIDEFILELWDIEDDGDLTVEYIFEWYW